jgi:hypothetical protein
VFVQSTPLPSRAMLLDQISPFDYREFEPAGIEPHVLPAGE